MQIYCYSTHRLCKMLCLLPSTYGQSTRIILICSIQFWGWWTCYETPATQTGLWNKIWSDIFIETTFMRYGHWSGGLLGITLNNKCFKRWVFNPHTCSPHLWDLKAMRDTNGVATITPHKEQNSAPLPLIMKTVNNYDRGLKCWSNHCKLKSWWILFLERQAKIW